MFLKVVLENLVSISISEAIHTILSSELEVRFGPIYERTGELSV